MGSPGFATPEYLRLRNGRLEGVPCSVLRTGCHPSRPAGEETVQEAHSCRCPQGFQRQLFRFDQVQGLCKPGDLVTRALLCQSKCIKLKSGRLAEEVTDCGPVVDLKKTPGCQLLKGEADPKANYPDCCPVYDCEEGTEVVYVTPPSTKKADKKEGE